MMADPAQEIADAVMAAVKLLRDNAVPQPEVGPMQDTVDRLIELGMFYPDFVDALVDAGAAVGVIIEPSNSAVLQMQAAITRARGGARHV